MSSRRIATATLALFVLVGIGTARAQQGRATPQDVVERVRQAAQDIAKTGEAGLATFDSMNPTSVWKDSYTFVVSCQGGQAVTAAHPTRPELKGQPVAQILTFGPKPGAQIAADFCTAGRQPHGGWVEYNFPKLGGARPARKVSYLLAAQGTPYVVGAGIYDENATIQDLNKLAGGQPAAATAPAGQAQTEPSRPVQLVVAYPPGGLGDIVAHALSEGLASALGQPVTVENRPGASGAVGAQSVARAAPDGRTLLVGQTAEVAIDPNLAKNLGYEPARDLEPVALAAVVPLALVVPAKAPYATLEDLLEAARTSPRGLSFASAGPGTPGHFAGELLRLRRTSRLTHVPYDGAGPALEDLVRGRVDFYFASLPSAMPYVTAGKLKILALSSARRSPAVPTIPTVEEAGIKNFDITLWAGIFAPRGTPREMVQRLNQEINQILGRPEVRDPLRRDGAEITPMSVDQFADFVSSEASKYAKITLDDFCSRFMFGGCVGYGLYNPL